MSEEIFEQTFEVSKPARLVLNNIRGSTRVEAGEEGLIQVRAVVHTETGDEKRTEVKLEQESDGTVKVATRFPEGALGWLSGSHPCKVDYTVQAPRACDLKVGGVSNTASIQGFEGDFSFSSVSGDLTLSDMLGPLSVNMVSGDIELADVKGALKLHSVSGELTGRRLAGTLNLDTVSGNVELQESDLPSAHATSVSGSMELETSLGEGPYHFNSVSGEVALKVPAETACTAELHSISGGLSTKLPSTSVSRHNGTQVIEIQGGGVQVKLSSVSGDLKIKS
ncbi:MAG: DUF4097 family beta strand repeat protein [Anaerolineales bacterium]|nr:DUF4097 family beta strand repeat protein [Anaerolineales bacterium]